MIEFSAPSEKIYSRRKMDKSIAEWVERAKRSEAAVRQILIEQGHDKSRIPYLHEVSRKLDPVPMDVQEYFQEAIVCLKYDLTRSAVVMSWAGFFSLFCERLYSEKHKEISAERPKWNVGSIEDLKEYPEAQIVELAAIRSVGFIRKPKKRMLDGWLSQRNQCAHPTVYRPTLNQAIGYVDGLIDEVAVLIQ